jgi:hypothetical protein
VLEALDHGLAVVRDGLIRVDEGFELLVERDAVRLEGVVQVADRGGDPDFGLGDGRLPCGLNEDGRLAHRINPLLDGPLIGSLQEEATAGRKFRK